MKNRILTILMLVSSLSMLHAFISNPMDDNAEEQAAAEGIKRAPCFSQCPVSNVCPPPCPPCNPCFPTCLNSGCFTVSSNSSGVAGISAQNGSGFIVTITGTYAGEVATVTLLTPRCSILAPAVISSVPIQPTLVPNSITTSSFSIAGIVPGATYCFTVLPVT
jgi:hypothetical protein